jgi:hypothetical protein
LVFFSYSFLIFKKEKEGKRIGQKVKKGKRAGGKGPNHLSGPIRRNQPVIHSK